MNPSLKAPMLPRAASAGAWRVPSMRGDRFLLVHAWIPLGVFLVALVVATFGHGNWRLADLIYGSGGHAWPLRHAYMTEQVIHVGGRDASALAWGLVLAAWGVSMTGPRWSRYRRPLAYLVLATLLSAALVAWIKLWSNMDCPWDLARYGGTRPYVGLFDLRPSGLGRNHCFPAGHASSGYAWLALYFFFLVVRPGWRWAGLAVGAGTGLVFGFSQQLRGAHFLSHDLWTIAICWSVALGLYLVFWRRTPSRVDPAATTPRSMVPAP